MANGDGYIIIIIVKILLLNTNYHYELVTLNTNYHYEFVTLNTNYHSEFVHKYKLSLSIQNIYILIPIYIVFIFRS